MLHDALDAEVQRRQSSQPTQIRERTIEDAVKDLVECIREIRAEESARYEWEDMIGGW